MTTYCGSRTTVGHGETDICGEIGMLGRYQCAMCGLADMRAENTSYTRGTTATAGAQKPLRLEDILKAAEKIKAMPKGKWMLVAPDGRVWADEDPQKLALPLAAECMRGVPSMGKIQGGRV